MLAKILVSTIMTLAIFFAFAQGYDPERRGCRVVPDETTSCDRSVTGVNCRDRRNLKNYLINGITSVMVCQSWNSEPFMTDILVALGMQWGPDCKPYLGVTSICFIPDENETQSCDCLSELSRYERISCNNQAEMRARLVNRNTTRICLLNPRVNPQVFVDTSVSLYATLGCINGLNVSGELCS